jgi:hypothetical protein
MALADWTLASDSTPTWTLTSTYAIKGTFSGAVFGQTPADPTISNYVVGYSLAPVNAQCGRIRTMYKFDPTLRGNDSIGVFCQMQTAISAGNSAYIALVKLLGETVSIHKNNIVAANGEVGLAQTAYGPLVLNSVYAIQLNWQTDPVSGDMLLIVSVDGPIASPSTYDYSTLTPIIEYTDSLSPLTTCFTVGLAGRIEPVASPGHYIIYDGVDIYTD